MKKVTLAALALVMLLVLTGCGKSEAVKNAESLISAIGTVTLDSGDAITAAEDAVSALEEKDLKSLEGAETLTAARTAYDALVLTDAIDRIGTVTLTSEEAITQARKDYDAAPETVQQAVTNVSKLEAAEAEYEQLAADNAVLLQVLGKDLLSRLVVEKSDDGSTTIFSPAIYPEYIDERPYVLCYVAQDSEDIYVDVGCCYVGSTVLNWTSLTYTVDGASYEYTCDVNDVEHRKVGGLSSEILVYGADEDMLDLLTLIAMSDETTVTFAGEGGDFTFTMSQEDKSAITDALATYIGLALSQAM